MNPLRGTDNRLLLLLSTGFRNGLIRTAFRGVGGAMASFVTKVAGVLVACGTLWGQGSTAQINGTVRDASGLAVPDAAVKVTQTATGAIRTTTSGQDGAFV